MMHKPAICQNLLARLCWLLFFISPVLLADTKTEIETATETGATILPFNAEYTFKRNGFSLGSINRNLSLQADNSYIFESYTKTGKIIALFYKDKITERSHWRFIDGRPRPTQYLYHRRGGKRERHVELRFDWKKKRVTNIINSDPWRMQIPPDTQDKLLYQITIMQDLADKKPLEYIIADGGKLKDYAFEIIGTETIKTGIGNLETIKIKRINDKRNTTIWCAPSRHFFPVRILQKEKDGTRHELLIKSLQGI